MTQPSSPVDVSTGEDGRPECRPPTGDTDRFGRGAANASQITRSNVLASGDEIRRRTSVTTPRSARICRAAGADRGESANSGAILAGVRLPQRPAYACHHHRSAARPRLMSSARQASSSASSLNSTAGQPGGTASSSGRAALRYRSSTAARAARSQTGSSRPPGRTGSRRSSGSANRLTMSTAAGGSPAGRRSAPASIPATASRVASARSALCTPVIRARAMVVAPNAVISRAARTGPD